MPANVMRVLSRLSVPEGRHRAGTEEDEMNGEDRDALGTGVSVWLADHLKVIEAKIKEKAKATAEDENHDSVQPADIAAAAMLYAPGKEFPLAKGEADLPFWRRMALSITGVTLVSAALAVAFGVIGYYIGTKNPSAATGAFDIAKIFAGAVVGSTGASVAATVKRG